LNVPAVKIFNSTGVGKSKEFCRRLGITFGEKDDSLGLALGGFSQGVSLLELTAAYTPFARGGRYKRAQFIKSIADDKGNTVYRDTLPAAKVMREDTAYLVTDMLKSAAAWGTAGKLAGLGIPLASKTGTVGNKEYNTDAYNISYTAENTFCVWIGGGRLPLDVTGGTKPTAMAKALIAKTYAGRAPEDFVRPDGVEKCVIDAKCLADDHVVRLASDFTPERYTRTELFSSNFKPQTVSELFARPKVNGARVTCEGRSVRIEFDAAEYIEYDVLRECYAGETFLCTVKNKKGAVSVADGGVREGDICRYIIRPKFTNNYKKISVTGEVFFSDKIVIPIKFRPASRLRPDENLRGAQI
jgi:membrane peptidoglycan carboxypeptidase